MVGPLLSLQAGFGHCQFSPLLLVVVKATDVLVDLGEEPVSLKKEDGSDDIHMFEVVDELVLQCMIHFHLQQYLSISVGDCCFLPHEQATPKG